MKNRILIAIYLIGSLYAHGCGIRESALEKASNEMHQALDAFSQTSDATLVLHIMHDMDGGPGTQRANAILTWPPSHEKDFLLLCREVSLKLSESEQNTVSELLVHTVADSGHQSHFCQNTNGDGGAFLSKMRAQLKCE